MVYETFQEICNRGLASWSSSGHSDWIKTAMSKMDAMYTGALLLDELSMADLALLQVVDMSAAGYLGCMPAEYIDGFANLKKAWTATRSHPAVEGYYENYQS